MNEKNGIETKKPDHVIAIGIGGTGAKCIEALVHLAASGHAPDTIFPILIDQDSNNGNVARCKNTLQAYSVLQKNIHKMDWFFKPTFDEIHDELLPLLPQDDKKNFSAAIGLPSMNKDEEAAIKALYLQSQLDEKLDYGYKKRAHMGSPLIEKMLEEERKKKDNEVGLNYMISKAKSGHNIHVVIYGSLFGGTGASGLIRIGKYFKNHESLKDATIKGVFLTPYFVIGKGSASDDDSNLVKSDADMQAVKISLQIYKDEINESFDNVFIIGSEISKLTGETVTEKAVYGGKDQENPAHLFEMIAATVATEPARVKNGNIISFISSTENETVPLRHSVNKYYPSKGESDFNAVLEDLSFKTNKIVLTYDFAYMLYKVRNNDEKSWWLRQPWADLKNKGALIDWAVRHYNWWNEMSPNIWNEHIWRIFSLYSNYQIDEYTFGSLLSRYYENSSSRLVNLFKTIEIIEKTDIRRLKWASI